MRLLFAALLVVALAIVCLILYALVKAWMDSVRENGSPWRRWKNKRATWRKSVSTRGGRVYIAITKGAETNTLTMLDPASPDFEVRLAEESSKAEDLAMTLNANERN